MPRVPFESEEANEQSEIGKNMVQYSGAGIQGTVKSPKIPKSFLVSPVLGIQGTMKLPK